MNYEIEKDIPIPNRYDKKTTKYKSTAIRMEIGDSFFIPNGDEKTCRNFMSSARNYVPLKFATRVEENGLRVWRTK